MMDDVNCCWPVSTPKLSAKSVRHMWAIVVSCLVIRSQNTASCAWSVWHLYSEHCAHTGEMKSCVCSAATCVSEHVSAHTDYMQAACFQQGCSPTYCSDKCILERCSAGHAVSQVSMSQAGSVCDLHSHMPSGLLIRPQQRGRCCVVQAGHHGGSSTVTQRAGGGYKVSVQGSEPGHLFFKGRLILVWVSLFIRKAVIYLSSVRPTLKSIFIFIINEKSTRCTWISLPQIFTILICWLLISVSF